MRKVKRPTTLVEEVVGIILDAIKTGELKPGQKMEAEVELAHKLQVARTTLRESIMLLMGMGVLRKDHEGVFVADDMSQFFANGLIPKVMVQGKITELYEARKFIEGELAALAAVRASDSDIKRIKQINQTQAMDCDKESKYKQLDIEFHQAVATAAHNSVLYAMWDVIKHMCELLEIETVDIETVDTTVKRHEALIEAIEQRDPVAARECARRLVEAGEEMLRKERDKLEAVNVFKSLSGL